MDQVKELLEVREKELLQIKRDKENALKTAPKGKLRINSHGKRTQYYHRTNPKDFNGVYIKEKDILLAEKLAQKDYDQKVLDAVEKELSAIHKYNASYPLVNAEQVYEKLHRERQKLILPIEIPVEQYVSEWKSIQYERKGFYVDMPEYYTARGERVRSKSEVIIADTLDREGVPYRYEYPIYLKGVGKIHPDFTVLNVKTRKEVLWEHLGMMDDEEYVENAIERIVNYEKSGIFPGEDLVLTYETKRKPLNQKEIRRLIRHYLQ